MREKLMRLWRTSISRSTFKIIPLLGSQTKLCLWSIINSQEQLQQLRWQLKEHRISQYSILILLKIGLKFKLAQSTNYWMHSTIQIVLQCTMWPWTMLHKKFLVISSPYSILIQKHIPTLSAMTWRLLLLRSMEETWHYNTPNQVLVIINHTGP